LKILAEYLDLSPATVSIVLNNSPVAKSISDATKARVHAAAKKFEYRPNLHARMLRTRVTNTVGLIVPEVSEGYFTTVMLGVEQYLLQEGFLYFTVSHLGRPDLVEEYPQLLMNRAVDGFLMVNTELRHKVPLPVVGISSHSKMPGVTNVVLDHRRAAKMALRHLYDLGHRRIAFMRGSRYISDTDARWRRRSESPSGRSCAFSSKKTPGRRSWVILRSGSCSRAHATSPRCSASTTRPPSEPSAPSRM
jgi:LacI family transcriptional regulator